MVAAHPVLVSGLNLGGAVPQLSVLQRTDQNFVAAILDELASEEGRSKLAGTLAADRGSDGVLKLYQPTHRTFHVALVELACDAFGRPRLNPDRIESAGLVVRRVASDTEGAPRNPEQLEGWMKAGAALRGWVTVGRLDSLAGEADPDPERRTLPYGGPAEIRQRLAQLEGSISPFTETESPLFPVPPEVQKAASKTALYGVISLASAEASEAPDQLPEYSADEVRSFISPLLQAGDERDLGPRAGDEISGEEPNDPQIRADLQELITLAEQADAQFNAFGDSPEGEALLDELNRISLPLENGGFRAAGEFLRDFRDVMALRDGGSVVVPSMWPVISNNRAAAILDAARAAAQIRLKSIAPREQRFGDRQALYRLRAFVRLQGENGCPGKTIWSEYSDRFRIAPWYEPGPAPPVPVDLPDVTSESVRNLKPNVAFQVPESLFNTLNLNNLSDLIDGKGEEGKSQFGLGWICSINLPVITICAFIVLSIFLSLFDLFFKWLLFIKICLPFPKKK